MQFTVDFDLANSPSLTSLSASKRADVLRVMRAAADSWARYLTTANISLNIGIRINAAAFSGTVLASGGPERLYSDGTKDGSATVWTGVAERKLETGTDLNGSAYDIIVDLTPDAVNGLLYFRPDPLSPINTVPAGKYDAMSTFQHELGHGLGILSFSDSTADARFSVDRTTFEALIDTDGAGNPFFVGANAKAAANAVFGVPLEMNSIAHFKEGGTGDDLMSPAVAAQDIDGITAIDLAILQDLGIGIRQGTTASDTIYAALGSRVLSLKAGDDTGYAAPDGSTFHGDDGNDTLIGSVAVDTFFGDAGDDVLTGGAANDFLFGGLGTDTAVYSGFMSDYTLTQLSPQSWQIRDRRSGSPDGTDALSDIERVRWSDGTFFSLAESTGAPLQGTPGDLDGDGRADILLLGDNGTVSSWRMNAAAVLGSGVLGVFDKSWQMKGVGDFNADGKADLLWQNATNQVGMLLAGTSTMVNVSSNPGPGWHVRGAGDFDGDGRDDILFQHDSGAAGVWSMSGSAVLTGVGLGTFDQNWQMEGIGDFDGDGKADLLWQSSTNQVGILLNGSSTIANVGANPGAGWHVRGAGDFDGDSRDDILLQHDSGAIGTWQMRGLNVTNGTGVGTFDTSWRFKGISDFNADGRADILWQSTSNQAGILFAGSTSIVSVGPNPGAGWHVEGAGGLGAPNRAIPSDFDGDGRADVVLEHDTGAVGIWHVNGSVVLSGTSLGIFDPTSRIKAFGDFNGDGKSDILWENGSNQAGILFSGSSSITAAGSSPGPGWHVKGAGDFDGDGKADILFQNDSGAVGIWHMNGAAVMGGTGVGTFDTSWQVKGTADFNGDGKADILWQRADLQAGILFGGTATIANAGSNPGAGWHVKGGGDFDGDGTADILLQNDSGAVGIWKMNGISVVAGTGVGTFDKAWQVKAVNDFDGDGRADILWQNESSQVGVLLGGSTNIVNVGSNPGNGWLVASV